jgi:hypothetical protein
MQRHGHGHGRSGCYGADYLTAQDKWPSPCHMHIGWRWDDIVDLVDVVNLWVRYFAILTSISAQYRGLYNSDTVSQLEI